MKYILIVALIYMIVKYNTLKSLMSSTRQNQNQSHPPKQSKTNDDEGEYIDYEEVE